MPSQYIPAPHSLSGSVPGVIGAQVPLAATVLAAMHAWQLPVQAESQHTPSAHCALRHSAPLLQAEPRAFLATHWLAMQWLATSQSASPPTLQSVRQLVAVPSHTYGAQLNAGGMLQVP
jgi:hypothetical protein